MEKKQTSVYVKINEIAKLLGKVNPDGRNVKSKYNYISYEQLNAKLRHLLPENNLSITPEVIDYSEKSTELIKKDQWGEKTQQVIRSVVTMKFYITDTETGETIERLWTGADQDYGGKSCGQAITEAVKRFEMKLFHVSSKEDKDPDTKTTNVESDCPKDLKPTDPDLAKKKKLKKAIGEGFKLLPKDIQLKLQKVAGKSSMEMNLEELQNLGLAVDLELDMLEKAKDEEFF